MNQQGSHLIPRQYSFLLSNTKPKFKINRAMGIQLLQQACIVYKENLNCFRIKKGNNKIKKNDNFKFKWQSQTVRKRVRFCFPTLFVSPKKTKTNHELRYLLSSFKIIKRRKTLKFQRSKVFGFKTLNTALKQLSKTALMQKSYSHYYKSLKVRYIPDDMLADLKRIRLLFLRKLINKKPLNRTVSRDLKSFTPLIKQLLVWSALKLIPTKRNYDYKYQNIKKNPELKISARRIVRRNKTKLLIKSNALERAKYRYALWKESLNPNKKSSFLKTTLNLDNHGYNSVTQFELSKLRRKYNRRKSFLSQRQKVYNYKVNSLMCPRSPNLLLLKLKLINKTFLENLWIEQNSKIDLNWFDIGNDFSDNIIDKPIDRKNYNPLIQLINNTKCYKDLLIYQSQLWSYIYNNIKTDFIKDVSDIDSRYITLDLNKNHMKTINTVNKDITTLDLKKILTLKKYMGNNDLYRKNIKTYIFREFNIRKIQLKYRKSILRVGSSKLNISNVKGSKKLYLYPISKLIHRFKLRHQITLNTQFEEGGLYITSTHNVPFIFSNFGFLFINSEPLYSTKPRYLESASITSKINKYRYSFFYKNDIKKLYLQKPGKLKLVSSLLNQKQFFNNNYIQFNTFGIPHNSITGLMQIPGENTIAGSHYTQILSPLSADEYFVEDVSTEYPKNNKIKRIRFKPGYSRIWRRAREAINYTLRLNVRYQYRLSRRLHRLKFTATNFAIKLTDWNLNQLILNSRFAYDLPTSTLLIKSHFVFINGSATDNPNLILYVGDFIQLIVSLKFYIISRWLINWNLHNKLKLNKLSQSKNNKSRRDMSKQKSNHIPDWVFTIGYRQVDIPKYLEVDYFTLSSFIIYEANTITNLNPLIHVEARPTILNMYNWKYIN